MSRSITARLLAPALAAVALSACILGPDDGAGTPSDDIGQSKDAVTVCAAGSTIKGIDVSHYQGSIDWAKVYGGGYRFAVMKATEGTSYVDTSFKTNWAASKKAGVLRGAYHFFRPSVDGVAQAKHFVATMGTLAADDLPPVCDLEVQDGVSDATVIARTKDFMTTVKQLTGRTPMLYSGYFFTSLGSPSGFSGYPLWVPNWGVSCPNIPNGGWKTWKFWQYTDKASIPGISGAVDADKYNGSLADLKAWLQGPDQAATGSFDKASCTTLTGWAWDPDTPNTALSVSIYDGDNKTGTLVTKLSANEKRSDLCTKLGSCNHGFSAPLPAKYEDGKQHSLRAYTTGNQGGAVALGGNPKTLTCDPPTTGSGGAGGSAGSGGAAGGDTGGAAGSGSGGAETGGGAGAELGGAAGASGSGGNAGKSWSSGGASADSMDSNGSCSLAPAGRRSDAAFALIALGLALALRRRH